jgi:DNA polymerase III epsilon subunit-like protein
MVDIETTGSDNHDLNAMIQLAAIKFNAETGEIGGTFNRCLAIPPKRFWAEDTRTWWMNQNREVFNSIIARMEDPGTVMRDYVAFATSDGPLRFWAKPIAFDYGFVQSYCNEFGLPMPHHYRTARDLNTYIAAQAGGFSHVDMPHIKVDGNAHDALVDCVYQLKCLFAARDKQWAGSVQDAQFEDVPA